MIDGSGSREFLFESRVSMKLVVSDIEWGFFYHDVIYKYFKCDKNYMNIWKYP